MTLLAGLAAKALAYTPWGNTPVPVLPPLETTPMEIVDSKARLRHQSEPQVALLRHMELLREDLADLQRLGTPSMDRHWVTNYVNTHYRGLREKLTTLCDDDGRVEDWQALAALEDRGYLFWQDPDTDGVFCRIDSHVMCFKPL